MDSDPLDRSEGALAQLLRPCASLNYGQVILTQAQPFAFDAEGQGFDMSVWAGHDGKAKGVFVTTLDPEVAIYLPDAELIHQVRRRPPKAADPEPPIPSSEPLTSSATPYENNHREPNDDGAPSPKVLAQIDTYIDYWHSQQPAEHPNLPRQVLEEHFAEFSAKLKTQGIHVTWPVVRARFMSAAHKHRRGTKGRRNSPR